MISAPRSALSPTTSKAQAPATKARKKPNRTWISPWPMRSSMRMNTHLAGNSPASTARAQGCGHLARGKGQKQDGEDVLDDEHADGRAPASAKPARPFSSRILTAKTVDEKLRAKAMSRAVDQSRPEKKENPAADNAMSPAENRATVSKHVQGRPGPDLGAQQAFHAQLEPDGEEQDGHADFGHGPDGRSGDIALGGQDESGQEIADQRRQAGPADQVPAAEGEEDDERIERHGSISGQRL